MLIVITPPDATPKVIDRYNSLFALGLEALHLRLPNASREAYKAAICAIEPEYRHRVVLCDYFDLVETAGVGGVHLRSDRLSEYAEWQKRVGRISVSAHSIEELRALPFVPSYALLSPLFDSISKPGYRGSLDREQCRAELASLPFPVIALGGITPERAVRVSDWGFAGCAVLGYLAEAVENLEEAFLRLPRPEVLTIAGHDPCSGAGVAADIRAIEALGGYPLSVITALTVQHELHFEKCMPILARQIEAPLRCLLEKHRPLAAKIGLVSSLEDALRIASVLKENGVRYIVWDPVLKASASDNALHERWEEDVLEQLLESITLITPNLPECQRLFGTVQPEKLMVLAQKYRVNILLKGGHGDFSESSCVKDILLLSDGTSRVFTVPRTPWDKHGTGCLLSAGIATRLAQGYDLPTACRLSQLLVDALRRSNATLLGTHDHSGLLSKKARLSAYRLQYITDSYDKEEVLSRAKAALDAGVRWIQLRMKEATSSERLSLALPLKKLVDSYGGTLIINDDVEVALACDAHGVHLGLKDIAPSEARKRLGPDKIVGGTCNRPEDIAMRALQGVDYVGVGPYRHTETKRLLSPILGKEGMQRLVAYNRQLPLPLPLFAIGGIVKEDLGELAGMGVQGVALSGLINRAKSPYEESVALVEAVNREFNKPKR